MCLSVSEHFDNFSAIFSPINDTRNVWIGFICSYALFFRDGIRYAPLKKITRLANPVYPPATPQKFRELWRLAALSGQIKLYLLDSRLVSDYF